MSVHPDQILRAGILRRDDASVLRFIELYQNRVYSQARRMLGNNQDAEEATQDILMKALNNMARFEGRSSLATWIYRIGYHTCLDLIKLRKITKGEEAIDQGAEPAWGNIDNSIQQLELEEQKQIIDRCLSEMEQTDAMVLDFFHLQEMSINEIADITGLTAGSIKIRLMRARQKLAKLLELALPAETINVLKYEKRPR